MKKSMIAAIGALCLALPAPALAQSAWPLDPGDLWNVTGVEIDDGHDLDYANFLASQWRSNQEFAKSQGWIKSYHVLSNEYPRAGEPDLYLVVTYGNMPDQAEMKRREAAYMAHMKRSQAQLQAESGGRAKFRKILSNSLLREMTFAR